MTCPVCGARMTHEGYFSWICAACGHRCSGELPGATPGIADGALLAAGAAR